MTVQEWKERFAGIQLPEEIRLDEASKIVNPKKFIDSHIAVLGNSTYNSGTFGAFELRLEAVWQILNPQG